MSMSLSCVCVLVLVPCPLSRVPCPVSRVLCPVSCVLVSFVLCPLSCVLCLVSCVLCPLSFVLSLVSFVLCPVSLCRIPGLYYGERLLMSHLMFLQSEEQMLYSGNGKLILFAGTTALRFTPYFCGDHLHVVGRNCNNCMLNIFTA